MSAGDAFPVWRESAGAAREYLLNRDLATTPSPHPNAATDNAGGDE